MGDFFSLAFLDTIRDKVLPGLWPMVAALVACAVLVPLAIRISRRTGLMAITSSRE